MGGKSKKKKPTSKRKSAKLQLEALELVIGWINGGLPDTVPRMAPPASAVDMSFADFHVHSLCSDGLLSPTVVVERAAARGVRLMSLTDHDTFAGVAEAVAAGWRVGVRVIPGVEISTIFDGKGVHLLAYFGPWGPAGQGAAALYAALARIRRGRFTRARGMLDKLRAIGRDVRWERLLEIAGAGVAPARPHVARALMEGGHVATHEEAFRRFIGDDGPAFVRGEEMSAVDAVRLVAAAGGVSVLAHPWSLGTAAVPVARALAGAGLDGMEAFCADTGRTQALTLLAQDLGVLPLGGSDFHGRGGASETDLGGSRLPATAVLSFLRRAQPRWEAALRRSLRDFVIGPEMTGPGVPSTRRKGLESEGGPSGDSRQGEINRGKSVQEGEEAARAERKRRVGRDGGPSCSVVCGSTERFTDEVEMAEVGVEERSREEGRVPGFDRRAGVGASASASIGARHGASGQRDLDNHESESCGVASISGSSPSGGGSLGSLKLDGQLGLGRWGEMQCPYEVSERGGLWRWFPCLGDEDRGLVAEVAQEVGLVCGLESTSLGLRLVLQHVRA